MGPSLTGQTLSNTSALPTRLLSIRSSSLQSRWTSFYFLTAFLACIHFQCQELMAKNIIISEGTLLTHRSILPTSSFLIIINTLARELQLTEFHPSQALSFHLWQIADKCQRAKLSGRALRKVHFLVIGQCASSCYQSGSLPGLCSLLQPQQEVNHQGVPGQPWEGGKEAAGGEEWSCPVRCQWWGEGEGGGRRIVWLGSFMTYIVNV